MRCRLPLKKEEGTMTIKRMLIPTDLSPAALHALEYAVDLAKPFDAELVLLFVLESLFYPLPDYDGAQSAAMAEAFAEQRRIAQRAMARLEKRYAKRGTKLRTLLQSGRPAEAIVDTAKRTRADLVVMATHGRTGVSRLLLGSVAERVVRTAPCPVLTLHAPSKKPSAMRHRRHARTAFQTAPRLSSR
jgi:nucleotide-binding universal stress UspA family protein